MSRLARERQHSRPWEQQDETDLPDGDGDEQEQENEE